MIRILINYIEQYMSHLTVIRAGWRIRLPLQLSSSLQNSGPAWPR